MKQILLLLTFLIASSLAQRSDSFAAVNKKHPSVIAALACIEQMAPIINDRQIAGPDVACDISISLSEKDLDELFKAALRSSSMSSKIKGTAEKYSAGFAKTVTNFRAADCVIKLRVKRSLIIEALSRNNTVLQLPDQPAACDVTTKKHKIQKLTFAFSPKVEMTGGCVAKFALNMGKIDANCRVCYFNRLYLSTKLVSLWANHMSKNAKRILNAQLGAQCQGS